MVGGTGGEGLGVANGGINHSVDDVQNGGWSGYIAACSDTCEHGLQCGQIGAVAEHGLGVILSHDHFVVQLQRGSAPHRVGVGLGSQIGKHLDNHVAARIARGHGGFDVGHSCQLGSSTGCITHHVVHEVGGKDMVAQEVGIEREKLGLGGVNVDDLLGRHAGSVSIIELRHECDARGSAKSDSEELIRILRLLNCHCHIRGSC